jgi:hypothetical protein
MNDRRLHEMTLILSVLALAAGLAVTEARAQGVAEEVRQPVTLARWALRHIQQRHWPESPAQGAGKFAPDITEESLRNMINEAVTNGRSRQNSHGRPGEIYEYDFGRPIGTTSNGSSASRLRVIINTHRQVVTAFPF